MAIEIVPYTQDFSQQWNEFCATAKNGLFIFDRNYMDYHSDRFVDASALVFIDGKLSVVFPANMDKSDNVVSHAGLTFGGLVSAANIRCKEMIEVVERLISFYQERGASRLLIKLLPAVFERYPCGDIAYALWSNDFQLIRRDLSSILPLCNSLPFNTLKKRSVKKAIKSNIEIRTHGLTEFYSLLSRVLGVNHETAPVHTLQELETLISSFPKNIVSTVAYLEEEVVAGTIIYKYDHVWHTQYLASSEKGRNLGALDYVISSLIEEAREAGCSYMSFGVSTVNEGKDLNEGLIWQKESFGARGITHDFYSLEM